VPLRARVVLSFLIRSKRLQFSLSDHPLAPLDVPTVRIRSEVRLSYDTIALLHELVVVDPGDSGCVDTATDVIGAEKLESAPRWFLCEDQRASPISTILSFSTQYARAMCIVSVPASCFYKQKHRAVECKPRLSVLLGPVSFASSPKQLPLVT